MKMFNDMELEQVVGGEAISHGSGASGGWGEYGAISHGSGAHGSWGEPDTLDPEPAVPENPVEKETEVIVVVVEDPWHRPHGHHKPMHGGFRW